MTIWTAAQLEALILLEGDRTQAVMSPAEVAKMGQDARPAVTMGCICPKTITIDGVEYENKDGRPASIVPTCEIHGCKSRFIARTRLTQRDERQPAVGNRKGGR